MPSPELHKFILDRSLGRETRSLDPISEELFQMYISDPNSSTIREIATVLIAGYDPIPGKHGRDAIDPVTGKPKEAKPKSYTEGTPTNGGGCFNDYTRKRLNMDIEEKLDLIHSLFVGDRVAYVVEFGIEAIQPQLDKQIRENCEEKGYQYVRNASWNYNNWIRHPSTRFHYIDWNLINANPGCINSKMRKAMTGYMMMAEAECSPIS